jgi:hypothetical protein
LNNVVEGNTRPSKAVRSIREGQLIEVSIGVTKPSSSSIEEQLGQKLYFNPN